jgi:hypothetical protein
MEIEDPIPHNAVAAAWPSGQMTVPAFIADAGNAASKRFIEFFTANIRNRNTRSAYAVAVRDFIVWCEDREHGRGPKLERRDKVNASHAIASLRKRARREGISVD